jgi:hypothetical protein
MRRIEKARNNGFLGGVPGSVATFHAHRDSKLARTSLNCSTGIAMPPVKGAQGTIEIPAGGSAVFNSESPWGQRECGGVCEDWWSVQQVGC